MILYTVITLLGVNLARSMGLSDGVRNKIGSKKV